jgi:cholinesterase
MYDNVTETVGCSKATDSLDCLRRVPYETLYNALSPFAIYPIVDGSFLTRLPSESFEKGFIADVAILAGTNTDECTAFAPRGTLNTDSDIHAYISEINYSLENATVAKVMDLYPDDPIQGCPFGTGGERFASQGYQFKRGAALIADEIFHAGRRFTVKTYASRPQSERKPVYSFRFDQAPWNGIELIMATVAPVFVTHFSEV